MSTQFRSRIKTVGVYGEEESALGGCCLPDGSKIETTVSDCNNRNGFFQLGNPDDLQCPDRGLTGACCACNYISTYYGNFESFLDDITANTTNSYFYLKSGSDALADADGTLKYGVKNNVSQCECNRLGGNWFYGDLSKITELKNLCNDYGTDVRVPGSCCHEDTNTGDIICTEICTSRECGNLATANYPTPIYGGINSGTINPTLCDRTYNGNAPAFCSAGDSTDGNGQEQQRLPGESTESACYTLKLVNGVLTHTCKKTTESACRELGGYWPDLTDSGINECGTSSGLYTPTHLSGSLIVKYPELSSTEVSLPAIGTEFQGGIYVGLFETGTSTISYRNNKTNVLTNDRVRDYGYGTTGKWALILYPRFYGDPSDITTLKKRTLYRMTSTGEKNVTAPASYFDGFFNTYGNGRDYLGYKSELFNDIRSLTTNGFNDWYIPSIDELSFVHKNLTKTVIYGKVNKTNRASKMILPSYFGTNIMSSTLYTSKERNGDQSETLGTQVINHKSYLWAQNFAFDATINNYGSRFYIDRKTPLSVPLVRRILIT